MRIVPWGALSAGAAAGAAVVGPVAHLAGSSGATLNSLLVGMVALVCGAAFALEDPTEDDLAGTLVGVAARRLVRIGLALPVLAVAWWALVALARSGGTLTGLPATDGAFAVEATALLALALWVAAVFRGSGAALAVPAVLGGLLVLETFLPARWALTVDPGDPELWAAAHRRWALLAVVAVMAFLWCSRDPARRGPRQVLLPARVRRPVQASIIPQRTKEQV